MVPVKAILLVCGEAVGEVPARWNSNLAHSRSSIGSEGSTVEDAMPVKSIWQWQVVLNPNLDLIAFIDLDEGSW